LILPYKCMAQQDLRLLYRQIQKVLKTLSANQARAYNEGNLWIVLELHKERWDDIMKMHSYRGEELRKRLMRAIQTIPNHMLQEIHQKESNLHISIDPDFRISVWVEVRESQSMAAIMGNPITTDTFKGLPARARPIGDENPNREPMDEDWKPLVLVQGGGLIEKP